jgi:hypothetical protein
MPSMCRVARRQRTQYSILMCPTRLRSLAGRRTTLRKPQVMQNSELGA